MVREGHYSEERDIVLSTCVVGLEQECGRIFGGRWEIFRLYSIQYVGIISILECFFY